MARLPPDTEEQIEKTLRSAYKALDVMAKDLDKFAHIPVSVDTLKQCAFHMATAHKAAIEALKFLHHTLLERAKESEFNNKP